MTYKKITPKKLLSGLLLVLYLVVLTVLSYSVVKSALGYQFDNDELYHIQQVYLTINQGLKPYSGFYSVYSPFLVWLLTPIFLVVGFSLKTIMYARMFMVGLFAIRMLLAFWLVKKIFGRLTAGLFVLLALLDPFTVFVAMQVRPENLMMVVCQLFLLILCIALTNKSKKAFFTAGLLAGLTLLVSIKIIPAMGAIICGIIYYRLVKKEIIQLLFFIDGMAVAFMVFFLYFFAIGNFFEMFRQLFIDPFLLNSAILYPTTLNYFYFSNPVIYGFEGKPAAWFYAISLPAMAFAGVHGAIVGAHDKMKDIHSEFKIILGLAFAAQWISMMFIHSVWIQYYIPLLWFYALFAAVLINDIYIRLTSRVYVRTIFVAVVIILLAILIKSSFMGNLNRSRTGNDYWINRLEPQWARIPKNAEVFPNILFRSMIYPVVYGGTYSPFILNRYKPVEQILEKRQVPYVILEGDTYDNLLPQTQSYIHANYVQDVQLPALYLRAKE